MIVVPERDVREFSGDNEGERPARRPCRGVIASLAASMPFLFSSWTFEDIARAALVWARAQTPLKTTNKCYVNAGATIDAVRLEQADAFMIGYLATLDLDSRFRPLTAARVCAEATQFLRFNVSSFAALRFWDEPPRSGNCEELSWLAFKYIYEHRVRPVDLVEVEDPGGHGFVVVGQTTGPSAGDHTYPKSFAEWDDTAWICDPWANIACPARNYEAQWRLKMRKWQRVGKKLFGPDDDWTSPIHPYWLNAIAVCEKVSLVSDVWPENR
jgi:hypothetical protein